VRSADAEVLTAAVQWLDEGRSVFLATVVRTWGSSPRPLGSLLAVCDDARFAGSVSGGCVEDDIVSRLVFGQTDAVFPRIESYGATDEQARRFGLPCGGRLDLAVERLGSAESLRAVLRAIDAHQAMERRVCLATGEASLHAARRGRAFGFDGTSLFKVFGPKWRLLLIGAGQLSRYVAGMAQALDYDVVVCDPRPEYAANWEMKTVPLDYGMPDDVVRSVAVDTHCAVLALVHDPKLDDLALTEALTSPAFYVGALGSKSNSAMRRERLAAAGVPADAIARLHAPIGLPIGSRTPAEIAIAILAELTAVRNGISLRTDSPAAESVSSVVCAASPASC
jgi:xanthine dehydrogenase accessory factor